MSDPLVKDASLLAAFNLDLLECRLLLGITSPVGYYFWKRAMYFSCIYHTARYRTSVFFETEGILHILLILLLGHCPHDC
jgi:hypothetical protein